MKKFVAILMALALCLFSVAALAEDSQEATVVEKVTASVEEVVETAVETAKDAAASVEAAAKDVAASAEAAVKDAAASAEAAVKEAANGANLTWLWIVLGVVVVGGCGYYFYKRNKK